MITVDINKKEVLKIPKIMLWNQQSIFVFLYSIFITIVFFIVFNSLKSSATLTIILIIVGVGCTISVMDQFFARQSISIQIDNNKIIVHGSLITNRRREFRIEDYSKIVLREYVGTRRVEWFCELHTVRKFINLYTGDKQTGELIAFTISKELNLPIDIILSKKILKKQVDMITSWIGSLGLIVLPAMIILFRISIIGAFIVLLIWIVLLVLTLPVSMYYIDN